MVNQPRVLLPLLLLLLMLISTFVSTFPVYTSDAVSWRRFVSVDTRHLVQRRTQRGRDQRCISTRPDETRLDYWSSKGAKRNETKRSPLAQHRTAQHRAVQRYIGESTQQTTCKDAGGDYLLLNDRRAQGRTHSITSQQEQNATPSPVNISRCTHLAFRRVVNDENSSRVQEAEPVALGVLIEESTQHLGRPDLAEAAHQLSHLGVLVPHEVHLPFQRLGMSGRRCVGKERNTSTVRIMVHENRGNPQVVAYGLNKRTCRIDPRGRDYIIEAANNPRHPDGKGCIAEGGSAERMQVTGPKREQK